MDTLGLQNACGVLPSTIDPKSVEELTKKSPHKNEGVQNKKLKTRKVHLAIKMMGALPNKKSTRS